MALTDTEIRKAKPQEKPYKVSDGAGLYIWVTPSGGRKWRASYRNDGKQKTLTLGGYPEVSLALARERHRDARKLLAAGLDPMDERKTIKTARKVAKVDSFAECRRVFGWSTGKKVKSIRHVDSVRRRMAADILPALGSRPIDAIEAPEVVAMTKAIEQRGAHDIAKRALETTGQVFRYAIAHGFAKRNPAVEIKPRRHSEIGSQDELCQNRRQRASRPAQEHRGLSGNACHAACNQTSGSDVCADQRTD